jgi:hypothetical protein
MFAENGKGKNRESQHYDSDRQEITGASDTESPETRDDSMPVDGEAESQVMNPNRRWKREELYDERLKRWK